MEFGVISEVIHRPDPITDPKEILIVPNRSPYHSSPVVARLTGRCGVCRQGGWCTPTGWVVYVEWVFGVRRQGWWCIPTGYFGVSSTSTSIQLNRCIFNVLQPHSGNKANSHLPCYPHPRRPDHALFALLCDPGCSSCHP